jgi:hypothetical protein
MLLDKSGKDFPDNGMLLDKSGKDFSDNGMLLDNRALILLQLYSARQIRHQK